MLSALLLTAPLLAQGSPSVHTVLQFGDVLSNGSSVTGLIDATLSDTGSWAAIANTTGGYVAVRDGALLLAVGELHRGELVTNISQVELDRSGTLGALYSVDDGAGGIASRLQVGPDIILEPGDPLPGPIGISGNVSSIIGFDFEGTGAAVAVSYSGTGGFGRALLVGSFAGGTFVPVGGWKSGDPITGLTRNYSTYSTSMEYEPSGSFAATILLDGLPQFEEALVADGVGLAELGGPGYAPNSTWTFRRAPRISINDSGATIVSGTIELSNGNDVGAIFNGTTPVAIEGGVPNGIIGDPVAPFERAAVQISDSGEPLFVLPFGSGNDRLMAGSETLILSGTAESDGELITGLSATSQDGRLEASSDGDTIIVAGRTTGGTSLFLVERDIDEPVVCAVTANSTGVPGELEALGSSLVSINDLTLRATSLPPSQFTLLGTSQNTFFAPNPGGSAGNLCIGPTVGRFNGQIISSGVAGECEYTVDLQMIPQPMAFVAGTPGETWYFQVWHRDVAGTSQTSNFTGAIGVELR